MIAAIVVADAGGRPLLRSADSAAPPRTTGVRELMLALPADHPIPLADSIVCRLGATAVRHGARGTEALNEAVRLTTADVLAILPAGVELRPGAFESIAATFDTRPDCAALASPVLLHAPDGLESMIVQPGATTPAKMLSDPRGVPSVMFVRRAAWEACDGLDERWGNLAMYECWLRLAFSGATIARLHDAIVAQEVAAVPREDPAGYLTELGAVYEHHRPRIEPLMMDVLVDREVRFGLLRGRHQRLIVERDRGLAELDRLRAETEHHRAYLQHHGLDAFDWGDLRRTDPVSRDWGYDRGGPIDRPYIEAFVESRSSDVRGAALEVQEDDCTRLAGGPRVTASTVLDIDGGNSRATVIADLRCAPELPSDTFDSVILTQTMHVIDDMPAVVREIYRVLRPGGVVLATLPSASRVCLEYGERGDLWRVTPAGARALFEPAFGDAVDADMFGNILTNVAFLHGLGRSELTSGEYGVPDPYYPTLTGIRARKGGASRRRRGTVLLYHRIHAAGDVHGLNVSPSQFEAHLAWLREHAAIVPLERLLAADPAELPERAVAITFDDGYEDNLDVAVPLLEKHGAAATFFVTTAPLAGGGEYWWDALERMFLDPGDRPSSIDVTVNGELLRMPAVSADDRLAAHWTLHRALVHATLHERDATMAVLARWAGPGAARYRPMRADALRRLASRPGMSIGAHSVSHVALPDQPDDAQVKELLESRECLSTLVGRPVTCFAYPYGAVDADGARRVRERFHWGMSCDEAVVPDSFDAARVPRIEVKAWAVDEFVARLSALHPLAGRVATPER